MSGVMAVIQRILAIISAILALFGGGGSAGEYTVDLYANQNSGYEWECTIDDPNVLQLTGSYYTTDSSEVSGGAKRFVFRAVSQGTCHVTFRYKSTASGKVVSTYVYTFEVDKNLRIKLISKQ